VVPLLSIHLTYSVTPKGGVLVSPTKVTLYVPGTERTVDVIPLIYSGGVGVDGKILGEVDETITEVPPIAIPGMSMSYVQLVRFQYPKQVGGGDGQY
jgi:hypothetical protein